jgi:hypothetical protein
MLAILFRYIGFICSLRLSYHLAFQYFHYEEEFEDTKLVIRIRNSKKDRQHNGQKKKDKKTNDELQSKHIEPH